MDVFVATLEAVAVLLGLGALGFWIIARRIVPAASFATLSPLALDIALPSLVFVEILSHADRNGGWRLLSLPLWQVGFFGLAAVFAFLTSYWVPSSFRPELRASLLYQNGLFFPLAIISGTAGPGSPLVAMLFLLTAIHPPLVFGTHALLWRKSHEPMRWQRIANPVVLAALLAVLLVVFDAVAWVPEPALRLLRLLGAVALPVIMLLMGGSIYVDLKERGPLHLPEVLKFLLLKLFVFPLLVLGLLYLLRPADEIAYLLLLQAAVPPISAIPVFAERLGGNRAFANQLVGASFVVSVASIPLMVLLFDRLFSPGF